MLLEELLQDERKAGLREGLREGQAKGELIRVIEMVCRKLKKNKCPIEIAEELEEDVELVERICEAASAFAPEYDVEGIYEKLNEK